MEGINVNVVVGSAWGSPGNFARIWGKDGALQKKVCRRG